MNFIKKMFYLSCCLTFSLNSYACNKERVQIVLPAEREWTDITTFPDMADENYEKVLSAYLQPIWHTREIYDETALIVGKEGSVTLLYDPQVSVIIRNYNIDTVYTEGIDYRINGKTITRIKDGNLPYFEIDDYYLTEPNNPSVAVSVDPDTSKIKFNDDRFLWFSEGVGISDRQISVSYKTDDVWKGEKPAAKNKKAINFVNKVKNDKSATILFYGDSITVGCNASGTSYGEYKNPYLPAWTTLVSRQAHATVAN